MKDVLLRRLRDERPFVLPGKSETVREFIKRAPMWEEAGKKAAPSVKNDISVTVNVPESGPVSSTTSSPETTTKAKRGSFK
jgi:hypothetical protein